MSAVSVRKFFIVSAVLTLAAASGTSLAQSSNSWTKPTSGNWEEAFWSLGRLPRAGDRVFVNNPGWKAVAIGAGTMRNFPASMQMQDLTIASPVDSFNTLLVNFTGFETPVKVTGRFTVESNAAALVLGSLLHVTNTGEFILNGTMRHADFSQVRTLLLHLGERTWGAAYHFSNGVFSADRVIVDSGSLFNQENGSSTISNLLMRNQAEFRLAGGNLVGHQTSIGDGSSAVFTQLGGHARWTKSVESVLIAPNYGAGLYILAAGTLTAPEMWVGRSNFRGGSGTAEFMQSGGTNSLDALFVISTDNARYTSRYALSNGLLRTAKTILGAGVTNATLAQHGGTHQADQLRLSGNDGLEQVARYELYGGVVMSTNLTMHASEFSQTGGSNLVAGDLVLGPQESRADARYLLDGGRLRTSNTFIGIPAFFDQRSGVHEVAHTLDLRADTIPSGVILNVYRQAGGELRVRDINLHYGLFTQTGGTIMQTGVFALEGGHLRLVGSQEFGSLRLDPALNRGLRFQNSIQFAELISTTVRFRQSSALPWDTDAVLGVVGWKGSTNGGGFHQLFVGNTAGGLTPQQLSQIIFGDPGGLPPGNYPARMLDTGEVVPGHRMVIQFSREGNRWVLRWEGGLTLQRAPEVWGFYQDLPGATSPFVIQPTQQREFFRLRK